MSITCQCGIELNVPASITYLKCPKCHGLLIDAKNPDAETTVDHTQATDLLDSLSDKWHQLHRWPLRNTKATPSKIEAFYKQWRAGIGCENCKTRFVEVESRVPPAFQSPERFSRWGWQVHNFVNLHKESPSPEISYKECVNLHNRLAVGFLNNCYMQVGGVETWMRATVPELSMFHLAGMVVANSGMCRGSLRQLGIRSAVGSAACGKLAAQCDVLISWNVSNLEDHLRVHRPYVIAMHHGHVSSEWTNQYILPQLESIDCVACVSQEVACHYQQLTSKRVEWLPCSVDPGRSMSTQPRQALRDRFGFTGKKVLLWVARQSCEKRPEVAIDALNYLPGDWILAMVTNNKPATCHDRLRVFVDVDNPADYIAAADVFLCSSREEGFCIALGEAMLGGLPVVSPAWGTAVDDSLAWRIQPDSNAEVIAGQVMRAYGRDTSRGVSLVKDHFAPSHIGAMWRHLISSSVCFNVPWSIDS